MAVPAVVAFGNGHVQTTDQCRHGNALIRDRLTGLERRLCGRDHVIHHGRHYHFIEYPRHIAAMPVLVPRGMHAGAPRGVPAHAAHQIGSGVLFPGGRQIPGERKN